MTRPSTAFKAAWVRQIAAYHLQLLELHDLHFPYVSIALMKNGDYWGAWDAVRRVIYINETLILHYPWAAVLGIVGHETVHQVVTDLDEDMHDAHGEAFRRMAICLGLDPFYAQPEVDLASGCPCPSDDMPPESTEEAKVLEKVRKLLALGGSPIAAEAENAMKAAARLMAKHNIDRLEAEKGQSATSCGTRPIRLGVKRIDARLAWISKILSRHFFVETIFVPSYDPLTNTEGNDLELIGRPENTAMAEYVCSFLLERTETLWQAHRKAHPGGGHVARNSFIQAMLKAFSDKLDLASAEFAPGDGLGGFSALVLSKGAGIHELFRRRFPQISHLRTQIRYVDRSSAEAGRKAGEALILSRPVENSPDGGHGPRFITDGNLD